MSKVSINPVSKVVEELHDGNKTKCFFHILYSLVPKGRGVGIVGGLQNPKNLISGGGGINGGLENCLKFNRRKYGKVLRESWYEKSPKQRVRWYDAIEC